METETVEKVICPSCGAGAEWIPNEQVYGRRYGKSYMCWYCHPCDFYVGCENNTRKPLGTMVGKELRQLRRAVHAKIDPLWRKATNPRKMRGHIYSRISQAIGKTYHTGEAEEEMCRKILSLNVSTL